MNEVEKMQRAVDLLVEDLTPSERRWFLRGLRMAVTPYLEVCRILNDVSAEVKND